MFSYLKYPLSAKYAIAVETEDDTIRSIRIVPAPQSAPMLDEQVGVIGPLEAVRQYMRAYFDKNADPEIIFKAEQRLIPSLEKPHSRFAASVREGLLSRLTFGSTMTYAELARLIGNDKAVRAVGQALHNNPFHIVIPCHRVVSKDPDKVYYAAGADVKRALLRHEATCIHAPVTAMIPF